MRGTVPTHTAKSRLDEDEVPTAATLRVLRPRRASPTDVARPTRAEINLAHVRHNLRELEACLGEGTGTGAARAPRTEVWPVLKADAYGHGAPAIARTLERAGVSGLCVALLEEGLELRNAGLGCPVLVMGGYYGRHRDGVEALVEHNLTPVVYEASQIESLVSALRYVRSAPDRNGPSERLAVHLKVDTGMARLGVTEADIAPVLAALRQAPELELVGLMTHLACADGETLAYTDEQLRRFAAVDALVRRAGFAPRVRHAANSAAMLQRPDARFELVRPGLAIYGVDPCPALPRAGLRSPRLRPVMEVVTEIVALRDVPEGACVGYGYTWKAARPSRIATIPIGYADGLSRALSNRGAVLVGGRRAPIVGTVSMDLTMVDVTDVPGAALREPVVVLGRQRGRLGEDEIGSAELAEKTGTIAWECLTSISRRVPRIYRQA
ncbi:MAG: alanine racemase [Polyangiaceae bacterium]|nr:alanine racemase [Polyangiaceae bacterium]